jgi:hypothetical protein
MFIGSKDDVLDRFVMAAREFNADRIIRAYRRQSASFGRNGHAAQDLADRTGAAYAGFSELPVDPVSKSSEQRRWKRPGRKLEIRMSGSMWHRFCTDARNDITSWWIRHLRGFRSPGTRITLDTPDDYEFLTQLFDRFYQGQPISLKRVVPYLRDRLANAG